MLAAALWTAFLAGVLGAIAWIDIRRRQIPDVLTLALAAAGLVYSYRQGTTALTLAIVTAAVTFAVLIGVRLIFRRLRGREGLGMGDVKLIAAAALWVGPFGISWLVLAACLSALAMVLAMGLAGRSLDRATRLPFGPHIALGLAIVLAAQTAL